MKYMKLLRYAAGSLAALLLSSCASTNSGSQARFHQQADCDAIVRFSSWDLITINKPETRANGYLPLYRLAEAEKVLARPEFPHRVAVVIHGSLFSRRQEADLQQKWAAIFGGLGYQRVVFLRAGFQNQVNGLAVIRVLPLTAAQLTGG